MTQRINILYLMRTWVFGGSHTIIMLMLKHLPAERYNILCIPYDTPSAGDDVFVKVLRDAGYPVPEERIPWRRRSDWLHARRTLSRLIEKYSADIVHTYDPHSNVLVGLGRRRWPCACVASAHGWWSRWFPLRSHVYTWIERQYALPNFERVLTVSQNMKGKILRGKTPEDRIRVIHTGLDPEALRPTRSRAETRRRLDIPENANVVGTVGRLFIEKGHTYLLQAAGRLLLAFPDLHVLIVGDGPLRSNLQGQAAQLGLASRVHFTGFYDDVPGALAAMDVFALPSILDEGFPTAVLEAQAMGLPVIASDVGGTCETIDVGKTGVLVRPKDVAGLAEALRALLADADSRQAMAQAARPWIERSFTLGHMIEQVSTAYEEALEEFRKPHQGMFQARR